MLRTAAMAAIIALALPTLAEAQGNNPPPPHGKPPAGKPGGPPPGPPHGPPGVAGPRPGGMRPGGPPAVALIYHGHPITRIHIAPFVYPAGWAYRRWAIGAVLPPLFLAPAYFYTGWAALGLAPPSSGFQWVRYGPDLLLVNVTTGEVTDVVYGVFY
jgi:hypothetical protein